MSLFARRCLCVLRGHDWSPWIVGAAREVRPGKWVWAAGQLPLDRRRRDCQRRCGAAQLWSWSEDDEAWVRV